MTKLPRRNLVRRIVWSSTFVVAIAVSLLVFPSGLLWMVAFWVAVASLQIWRRRSGWLPLAVCLAVLLIKRPDWSPGMISLGVLLFAAAIALWWLRPSTPSDGHRGGPSWAVIGAVWILWLAAVWASYDGTHSRRPITLVPDRPIVCLGDSLTTGLADGEAYPVYLRGMVSVPVINLGRAGVTARDMVKHLPEILESRPQVVVVELGGHDFLRGYGRAAARKSFVAIIEACRDAGAEVVLVEIPRGFIVDPFSGLERGLARQYDLELIPDTAIRLLVVRSPVIPVVGELSKPHWSDDGLHPNVAGARFLAETVFASLSRLYGSPVSSQ